MKKGIWIACLKYPKYNRGQAQSIRGKTFESIEQVCSYLGTSLEDENIELHSLSGFITAFNNEEVGPKNYFISEILVEQEPDVSQLNRKIQDN